MVFVNQIMRITYDMAQATKHSRRCREVICERIDLMQQEVRAILVVESSKKNGVPNTSNHGMPRDNVLDPNSTRCQGNTNSIPRSHCEPKRGRGRRRARGESNSKLMHSAIFNTLSSCLININA